VHDLSHRLHPRGCDWSDSCRQSGVWRANSRNPN
jgi:hypothetical protein